MLNLLSPNFQRAYSQADLLDRDVFREFFNKTYGDNAQEYAKGGNLSDLANLAKKVELKARRIWGNRHNSVQARQHALISDFLTRSA